jgi:type IV secretory pathway component VirB8
MDTQLQANVAEAWTKQKIIDNFLQNQQSEIEINVLKVSIEDLRAAPYKATVDFEEVFHNAVDKTETKRVFYTAHFVFSFRDSVPNSLIQINPLGLAISYFREDAAF